MKEKKHELTTDDIAALIGVATAHVAEDIPKEERDAYIEFAVGVSMAIQLHLNGKEPFPKEEIEMLSNLKKLAEASEPCEEESTEADKNKKKYELTEHDINKLVCLAVERTLCYDAPGEFEDFMMELAAIVSHIIVRHLNGTDPFDEQALKGYDCIANLFDSVSSEDEEGKDE